MKAKRDLLLILATIALTLAISTLPDIVIKNWQSPLWVIITAIVMYVIFYILVIIVIRKIFREVNKIDIATETENEKRYASLDIIINKAIEKQTEALKDTITSIRSKNKGKDTSKDN